VLIDEFGKNEIDIVAINEMKKRLCFCEVKRNRNKISLTLLKDKANEIFKRFPDYKVEYLELSMEDL